MLSPFVTILDASRNVLKGDMSAKTTYQRSARGPVAIAECSADGKSITIENTGRKVGNVIFNFNFI